MKFTGERYIPSEKGKLRLEHYHRYAMVCKAVSGKVVLDAACGEGYGSYIISKTAESVTGVDISHEAIAHASTTYRQSNLEFHQGSVTNLDFPDASFDIVVSFETIEHLAEQESMLLEIKRVLRSNGSLIISSPNRPVYSEESSEHNEFHVKELDFNEFDQILKSLFPSIQYYGQRMMMGSMIKPFHGNELTFNAYFDNGSELQAGIGGPLQDPVYFIAICSASNENTLSLQSSVLYPEDLDLIKQYTGFAKWAQNLEKELELKDNVIIELKRNTKLLQHNIDQMTDSISWRVTRPLRNLREKYSNFRKISKLLIVKVFQVAKTFYQSLPISYNTKVKHRALLAKHFPKLLIFSSSHYSFTASLAEPLTAIQKYKTTNIELLAKAIHIKTALEPTVTIIIPVYGKCNYTLGCLASIADNTPSTPFEIIVVDDCSTDETSKLLKFIQGIHIITNQQNQGFIRSCNIGANSAKGKFVYFLNNDTEVTSNWLDELVQTFDNFPGTGLVGSKLLFPDGKLQEAGGIIWQDGSAWNFGRLQDPMHPTYSYAREVDYCSGASIMIPSSLFNELGGFDEHYLPAYCEDSDLALKVRDKGYRVIYQPLSIVFHFEGITSGTDITQGTKAYQIENSQKLFERWKSHLKNHQVAGDDTDNAKDRRATQRALVIDHCTPRPNQDAGSVTVYNLMLLLREMDFQVTFIPEDNLLYVPEYTSALQRNGIEVLYTPYNSSVEKHLESSGNRYDLAFLFRPTVIDHYLQSIRKYCTKAKLLYHTVDLHHLRMSREAELQSDSHKQKAADKMKNNELKLIQAADASIVHSTAELDLLQPDLPNAKLHVFPLIMNTNKICNAFSNRKDIAFIGGYQHPPNIDAVQYFVLDIMPLLRQQLPGVHFYVIGSNPPSEIRSLASEDIIITGFVENLTPLLDKIRVSVAPLRFGAGIKGKIGSAMTIGLPGVGTSLAIEGMSLTDGENILVADDAKEFSSAIKELYLNEDLWNRISNNGLKFADETWGAEASWDRLHSILKDLDFNPTRSTHPLTLYSENYSLNKPKCQKLNPIATVKTIHEFNKMQDESTLVHIKNFEDQLLDSSNKESFLVDGYCIPCNNKSSFIVDNQSGGTLSNNTWLPNWRERLECTLCHMNNRQRLIASLIKQELNTCIKKDVYLMEQVTPIYKWTEKIFTQHNIIGSEYLGYENISGTTVDGIRHEDIENLSLENDSIDLIISNDVFEHVPNPSKAFSECVRVLKPGGIMLATIPFHRSYEQSIVRAKLTNNEIDYLLPALYHGNPVLPEGSLVFTDFGWDILEELKNSGFSEAHFDIYTSQEYAHLGGGQAVLWTTK